MKTLTASGRKKVKRVILFVNPTKKHALELGETIRANLALRKIEYDTINLYKKTRLEINKEYCMAISLGGDGTVLFAARTMSPLGIPVFPVNLGTFGFIAGVKPDEWREFFELWLNGKAPLSRRLMLEVKAERNGKVVFMGCCLNEAVISNSGLAKIVNLKVSCEENRKVYELGSYRSDGLIVSTPTGSTAHSLAAGGPVLDPELEAFILNPICPFALSSRPMVLPAKETIVVEVEKEQKSTVILTIDGQESETLKGGDKLYLKRASYNCLLIASGRSGFYDTLASKFNWAGGKSMGKKHD